MAPVPLAVQRPTVSIRKWRTVRPFLAPANDDGYACGAAQAARAAPLSEQAAGGCCVAKSVSMPCPQVKMVMHAEQRREPVTDPFLKELLAEDAPAGVIAGKDKQQTANPAEEQVSFHFSQSACQSDVPLPVGPALAILGELGSSPPGNRSAAPMSMCSTCVPWWALVRRSGCLMAAAGSASRLAAHGWKYDDATVQGWLVRPGFWASTFRPLTACGRSHTGQAAELVPLWYAPRDRCACCDGPNAEEAASDITGMRAASSAAGKEAAESRRQQAALPGMKGSKRLKLPGRKPSRHMERKRS